MSGPVPLASRSYRSTARLAFGRLVVTLTTIVPEPARCRSYGSGLEIVHTPGVAVGASAGPAGEDWGVGRGVVAVAAGAKRGRVVRAVGGRPLGLRAPLAVVGLHGDRRIADRWR